MDFFYHRPPIKTQVSVDIIEDNGPNSLFFDYVNVGSEDLGRLFPGQASDLAVTIIPEPTHPAFPPTGLACWVAPHNSRVRRETPITEPLMCGLPHLLAWVCPPSSRLATTAYPAVVAHKHYMSNLSCFTSAPNEGGPFCSD